jgi:hypothetical protein
MRRSGERGFDKYSEMGMHYWSIINSSTSCRNNLLTFFLSHNEIDSNGQSKVKTIGKLLDEKITIEGLFTTVLHTQVNEDEYLFLTQSDGIHNAKSPIGLFDDKLIKNDLLIVIDKMKKYFDE